MDEWLDIIRREAANVVASRQLKSTLVATGYDPATHSVKGILVPHGVETGWVRLAAIHAGNGFGIVTGPTPGDDKKLDGDQFDIEFDAGDPNTIIARHRQHSKPDAPPSVQSGEMLIQHKSGHYIKFNAADELVVNHKTGSQTIHKTDGRVVSLPAPGKIMFHGGDPDDGTSGQTFDFVMTASGASTNVKARKT